MKKVLDNFRSWRSIRTYLDKQINDETIKQLLKDGKDKLETVGDKVWSFTVIQNKKIIKELNILTKKDMFKKSDVDIINRLGKTPDFDIFYGAPTVIMISVKDKSKAIGDACSDAIHNIITQAKNLGLAANWNSFVKYHFTDNNDPEEKQKLDIPDDYTPYYAISIGYAK
ncbi:MAG: nitroreductase family protein [Spirochaetaceae bacterium]